MKTFGLKLTALSITLSASLIAITLLLITRAVSAAPSSGPFNVNSTLDAVDDNPGNGVCHTAANQCTLRAAVMEANKASMNVTVNLPSGVYRLTIPPIMPTDSITNGDLNLVSPLSGNPIMTIVGAGITQTIIDGHGTDRIFSIEANRTAIISRVTITNGHVSGSNQGGGIKSSGTLTINHSLIISNSAVAKGGGLAVSGHTLIVDTEIQGNEAQGAPSYGGGIEANTSGSGSLDLLRTVVENNSAQVGGGIDTSVRTTLRDSTVQANRAANGGGIYHSGSPALSINSSLIYHNFATDNGGGLRSESLVTLTNSTLSFNLSDGDAGGFYNNGTSHFDSVTIAFNVADSDHNNSGDGGGLWAKAGSNVYLHNTLISNNLDQTTSGNVYRDCAGTYISLDYNLVFTTTGCVLINLTGHNVPAGQNPLLAALHDNGGPTWTHALPAGSIAINHGDPAGCKDAISAPLLVDQRGHPRLGACDIGAYEYGTSTYLPLTLKNY